jgi:hypothetical protein
MRPGGLSFTVGGAVAWREPRCTTAGFAVAAREAEVEGLQKATSTPICCLTLREEYPRNTCGTLQLSNSR